MALMSMHIGGNETVKNFVTPLTEEQQEEVKNRLRSISSGEISTKTKDIRAFIENIKDEIQAMRSNRMTYEDITQVLNDMKDINGQPIVKISNSLFYRICREMGIAMVKNHVCPALTCTNRINGCSLICPGNGNTEEGRIFKETKTKETKTKEIEEKETEEKETEGKE